MKIHNLNVYLNQTLSGRLSIDAHGDMMFIYDLNYMTDKKNIPISQSLPFHEKPYEARECRPFFGGILPEAHIRLSLIHI